MNDRQRLNQAFAEIDDAYLVETASPPATKPVRWGRWAMAAVCFLLIAALLPWYTGQKTKAPIQDLSSLETAEYSAEDLAGIFEMHSTMAAEIKNYQRIAVPDPTRLDLEPLPTGEYIGIYEKNQQVTEPDSAELERFAQKIRHRLTKMMEVQVTEGTVREDPRFDGTMWLELEMKTQDDFYWVRASQGNSQNIFSVYPSSSGQGSFRKVSLGGEDIKVDQTQSDEEIVASLESIRQKLCWIFDVDFSSAKVTRSYYEHHEYGVTGLDVIFYDARDGEDPMTELYRDRIVLSFDNWGNYSGDQESATELYNVSVMYRQYRAEASKICYPIAKAKLLSLEEAEELLWQGIAFGGHTCPLCMQNQQGVSFEDYDYVGLEYLFGYDFGYDPARTGEPELGIPCYTFYQHLEQSENGNQVYAKTYVPAIELSGLQEYFEAQQTEHRTFS